MNNANEFKIPGLDDQLNEKLSKCTKAITEVLDNHFPELKLRWKDHFQQRILIVLYLEMIQAGIAE